MIASLGPNLPHDLLAAGGRYAGLLPWSIDRETPVADRWLESKFPPWTRSVLEDWAAGVFDHLDAVVFSRADDATQRLYYYVCELQRSGAIAGPEALVLDVAKVPRASSVVQTGDALRYVAGRLGIDAAALEASIVRTNERRDATTTDVLPAPTCLLAGTPPPDRRLHAVIEQAGWSAAGETLAEAWTDLGPRVEEGTGDPFAALAAQVHARPGGSRAFHDRTAALLQTVATTGAQAVVLWLAEEDDAAVWHVGSQQRALAAAAIPVLVATRRDGRGIDGIAAEIAAFLDGVRA